MTDYRYRVHLADLVLTQRSDDPVERKKVLHNQLWFLFGKKIADEGTARVMATETKKERQRF